MCVCERESVSVVVVVVTGVCVVWWSQCWVHFGASAQHNTRACTQTHKDLLSERQKERKKNKYNTEITTSVCYHYCYLWNCYAEVLSKIWKIYVTRKLYCICYHLHTFLNKRMTIITEKCNQEWTLHDRKRELKSEWFFVVDITLFCEWLKLWTH